MLSRGTLLGAALLILPTLAAAQSGGRSKAATGRDRSLMAEDFSRNRDQLSVRDIENQSPIKLLVDKRKDLKLTDAQLGQIKGLESTLKDKNAPLFRVVDSINKAMRPPMGEMSDDQRAKVRTDRQELMGTIKDIRDNYDAAVKDALPMLDESQQKAANELLAKQREDIEKTMRERMGAGRGDRDGSPRP